MSQMILYRSSMVIFQFARLIYQRVYIVETPNEMAQGFSHPRLTVSTFRGTDGERIYKTTSTTMIRSFLARGRICQNKTLLAAWEQSTKISLARDPRQGVGMKSINKYIYIHTRYKQQWLWNSTVTDQIRHDRNCSNRTLSKDLHPRRTFIQTPMQKICTILMQGPSKDFNRMSTRASLKDLYQIM